jgi:hypothetical protein
VLQMQALSQAIIDGIYAQQGAPSIPATTNTQLTSIHITDLTTSSSPAIDGVTGTTADLPYGGEDGTSEQGAQVATVITWQTVNRGRSFRGRSFFPGVPQNFMASSDAINVTWQSEMEVFWLAIHTAINTAGGGIWIHSIISRFSGGSPRAVGITTPVLTFRMNTKIATQRRRIPR